MWAAPVAPNACIGLHRLLEPRVRDLHFPRAAVSRDGSCTGARATVFRKTANAHTDSRVVWRSVCIAASAWDAESERDDQKLVVCEFPRGSFQVVEFTVSEVPFHHGVADEARNVSESLVGLGLATRARTRLPRNRRKRGCCPSLRLPKRPVKGPVASRCGGVA